MTDYKKNFFKLRGQLPKRINTILGIIGALLLLGLWQLLTTLGGTDSSAYGNDVLDIVYSTSMAEDNDFKNPKVLIYDTKPLKASELNPLLVEMAKTSEPLLIITNEANSRQVQSLVRSMGSDLNVKIAKVGLGHSQEVLSKIGDFTGSSIINADFFSEGEDSIVQINYLGATDNFKVEDNQVIFSNSRKVFSPSTLPSPIAVLKSFVPLWTRDNLLGNTLYSLYLNFMGYFIALLIALPLGFIIGLFPVFRGLFSRNVDALRFVPLTILTGLFIAWFGIGSNMKILFLAFGIFVYLLPIIVQRIDEVDNVYVRTAYTLGASKWQKIKSVFVPAVLSKVSDDIRVIVAISWTYIIVAEMLNAGAGGIGALSYKAARMSHIDKVFAILLVIILIGFIQDKIFVVLDRLIFPHKYQTK